MSEAPRSIRDLTYVNRKSSHDPEREPNAMSRQRPPVVPQPPRWNPNPDAGSIEIPGLDTNAPSHEQIEQIEQLITIQLQNIDENFSKIHNILANKILPSVKRYSLGTEPVRDAARFWTSFYEQAAQIRIPTYDDYSTVNETQSETPSSVHMDQSKAEESGYPDSLRYQDSTRGPNHSMMSTENSFAPVGTLMSSTPATIRVMSHAKPEDPSWASSIESPMVRLDREIQQFSEEDYSQDQSANETTTPSEADQTARTERTEKSFRDKGKGRDVSQPLLRNVFQNLSSHQNSPLRTKGKLKTPIPKDRNPYLPPNTDPANWSGIVDLADPSITTPQRSRRHKAQTPSKADNGSPESDDSWEGGLPPGMSPPVLMSPARPPRSAAELGLLKSGLTPLRLGRTPIKRVAAQITRDLIFDAQKQRGAAGRHNAGPSNSIVESSMSTVPTPPSLSRYKRGAYDSSNSMDAEVGHRSFKPSLFDRAEPSRQYDQHYSGYSDETPAPYTPQYTDNLQDDGMDDFSFSDEEVNTTMHPSAAFLMASAARPSETSDDSIDSIDSLDAEDQNLEGIAVHPFDRVDHDAGFDDDDSFDDYNEPNGGPIQSTETFFNGPGLGRGLHTQTERLRLHGPQLYDDTGTLTEQLAHIPGTPSPSPSPWPQQ